MIGITLGVGSYRRMAYRSAKLFQQFCKIPTYVAGDEDAARFDVKFPHFLKFYIFDITEEEDVVFFDPDLITQRAYDPRRFQSDSSLICVRDVPNDFGRMESEFLGFSQENYFNAGWFIANRSRHRELFELCKIASTHLISLWHSGDPNKPIYRSNPDDGILHDQAILNQLAFRTGTGIRFVDWRYNFMFFGNGNLGSQVKNIFSIHLIARQKDWYDSLAENWLPMNHIHEVDETGFSEESGHWVCLEGEHSTTILLRSDGTVEGWLSVDIWFRDVGDTLVLSKMGLVRLVLRRAHSGRWTDKDGAIEIRRPVM